MLKVYGYSDDLVEVKGASYPNNEIDCYNSDVRIRFTDGTTIRVGFPKKDLSVWWIEVEEQGTAKQVLEVGEDEYADIYSDIFYIDAEVKSHRVIKKRKTDN